MTIDDMIDYLKDARRQLGRDVDVVYIDNAQFCDILTVVPMREPTPETAWVWSGPVIVLTLDKA
jgi:hypothetical protein